MIRMGSDNGQSRLRNAPKNVSCGKLQTAPELKGLVLRQLARSQNLSQAFDQLSSPAVSVAHKNRTTMKQQVR